MNKIASHLAGLGIALFSCGAAASTPGEETMAWQGTLLWRASLVGLDLSQPVHELRALPGFRVAKDAAAGEFALDLGARFAPGADEKTLWTQHRLHRFWLGRAIGPWQVKLGRQEIRFGSARVLRVLNWFESLDPRDPASVAAGVDGMTAALAPGESGLGVTSWILFPSTGGEYILPFATLPGTLAGGGRMTYRLPGGGSGGLAMHRRRIDRHKARGAYGIHYAPDDGLWEQRVGSDGNLPLAVPLWYEASLVLWQKDGLLPEGMDFFTLGAAYPRGASPSWQAFGEFMVAHMRGSPLTAEQTNHYLACALDASLAADQQLSATATLGMDTAARMFALDYWYSWQSVRFGVGWYNNDLPYDYWGISGTVREPPDLAGVSGVRLSLRVDY